MSTPLIFSFLSSNIGVRKNIIYAGSIIIPELKASINHQNIISDFNDGHIFADFLDAAKRNDADVLAHSWQRKSLSGCDLGLLIFGVAESGVGIGKTLAEKPPALF